MAASSKTLVDSRQSPQKAASVAPRQGAGSRGAEPNAKLALSRELGLKYRVFYMPHRTTPNRQVPYTDCAKPGCDNPVQVSQTLRGKVAPNCGQHRMTYVEVAGHRTRSAHIIADAAIIVGWGAHPDPTKNQLHPYVQCTAPNCTARFPYKHDWQPRWKKHRKCKPCVEKYGRMRPWQGLYNQLITSAKQGQHTVLLTYDEFVILCEQNNCHYCSAPIVRRARGVRGDPKSSVRSVAYFVDRKDDRLPYSFDNCVVCCTPCNFTKSSWLSYAEMMVIGAMRSGDVLSARELVAVPDDGREKHADLIVKRTHLRLARWGGRKANVKKGDL